MITSQARGDFMFDREERTLFYEDENHELKMEGSY